MTATHGRQAPSHIYGCIVATRALFNNKRCDARAYERKELPMNAKRKRRKTLLVWTSLRRRGALMKRGAGRVVYTRFMPQLPFTASFFDEGWTAAMQMLFCKLSFTRSHAHTRISPYCQTTTVSAAHSGSSLWSRGYGAPHQFSRSSCDMAVSFMGSLRITLL